MLGQAAGAHIVPAWLYVAHVKHNIHLPGHLITGNNLFPAALQESSMISSVHCIISLRHSI